MSVIFIATLVNSLLLFIM